MTGSFVEEIGDAEIDDESYSGGEERRDTKHGERDLTLQPNRIGQC